MLFAACNGVAALVAAFALRPLARRFGEVRTHALACGAAGLPQHELGVYLGLLNIFIVVPERLVAMMTSTIMRHYFVGGPISTMAWAGGMMSIAALAMLGVREPRSAG